MMVQWLDERGIQEQIRRSALLPLSAAEHPHVIR
jgi:hypothetical protein